MKWNFANNTSLPPIDGTGHISIKVLVTDGSDVHEGYYDFWQQKWHLIDGPQFPDITLWAYKPLPYDNGPIIVSLVPMHGGDNRTYSEKVDLLRPVLADYGFTISLINVD